MMARLSTIKRRSGADNESQTALEAAIVNNVNGKPSFCGKWEIVSTPDTDLTAYRCTEAPRYEMWRAHSYCSHFPQSDDDERESKTKKESVCHRLTGGSRCG